jgi:hypothetical protein
MFRENLTNIEFITAANKIDWSVLDERVAKAVTMRALSRKISVDDMPPMLQGYYAEMRAREDEPNINPLEWMQENNERMDFGVYCSALSEFSVLFGAVEIETDEDEDSPQANWFWTDNNREPQLAECFVALTPWGLFFDENTGLSRKAYHLIGYCVINNIPWFSPLFMDLDVIMAAAESKNIPTQH